MAKARHQALPKVREREVSLSMSIKMYVSINGGSKDLGLKTSSAVSGVRKVASRGQLESTPPCALRWALLGLTTQKGMLTPAARQLRIHNSTATAFSTVSHAVVTSLLLPKCNVAAIINFNVDIWVPPKGSRPTGWGSLCYRLVPSLHFSRDWGVRFPQPKTRGEWEEKSRRSHQHHRCGKGL